MRNNKDKESELIARIKEGDTSEFRILVDKYKDVSFSLACSILKNEQDAEDALQDSFIKAFKGLKTFDFKSSFSTWFYKIIVNTCNTKYKNQKRNNQFIDFDSYSKIEIAENNTPFNEIDMKERKEIVNKVLDMIHEEESLLLRLFYLAELSIDEIKQITGFKDSKIKVTLHRARKSFQQRLEKKYGYQITLSS
jgi:RNA polymerase sigma-70 factor (ECF subfamily)